MVISEVSVENYISPGNGVRRICTHRGYLITANLTNGLQAFRSLNGNLELIAEYTAAGESCRSVGSDGEFLYAGYIGGSAIGIRAFTFDGSNFVPITNQNDLGNYDTIFCKNGYIYVAAGATGLHVYSFNGAAFTLHATQAPPTTFYDVWVDGSRNCFLAARFDGLYVYNFTGAALNFVDSDDQGGEYTSVFGNGGYVYATSTARGVHAYQLVGATLNFIVTQSLSTSNLAYAVTAEDGDIIAITRDSGGLGKPGITILAFDGNSFSVEGTYISDKPTGTAPSDVLIDANKFYVAMQDYGFVSYLVIPEFGGGVSANRSSGPKGLRVQLNTNAFTY